MRKCHVTSRTVFTSLSHVESFLMQGNRRNELRSYPCEHCNGYHVTKMSISDANKYFGGKEIINKEKFKKYLK